MGSRAELSALLKTLFNDPVEEGEPPGEVIEPHVYFQPPPDKLMEYPCIVYQRDDQRTVFANNTPYKNTTRYQVTVIDRNPDSDIPKRLAKIPMCSFERFFTSDGLNHDVYNLYF